MNIGDTNYGEVYASLEQAKALGVRESDVIELTREVVEQINPRYPVSHQSNKEKLRNLRNLQLGRK